MAMLPHDGMKKMFEIPSKYAPPKSLLFSCLFKTHKTSSLSDQIMVVEVPGGSAKRDPVLKLDCAHPTSRVDKNGCRDFFSNF